jgi:hypothetical protein
MRSGHLVIIVLTSSKSWSLAWVILASVEESRSGLRILAATSELSANYPLRAKTMRGLRHPREQAKILFPSREFH